MKDLLETEVPVQDRQVDVVHILNNGSAIMQRDMAPYAHLFGWLDHNKIEHYIHELKPQTDEHRKSIVAIFESGQIRTFANVANSFTNYSLLKKSGI